MTIKILEKSYFEKRQKPAGHKAYTKLSSKGKVVTVQAKGTTKQKEAKLEKVIDKFKQEWLKNYGTLYFSHRDNCGAVAYDFEQFAKKHEIKAPRINGTFVIDKPVMTKRDFFPKELNEMKKKGYNVNNPDDRLKFAKKKGLMEDLKKVPHSWNQIGNQIVDLSGKFQFIKKGLAKDLDNKRYKKGDERNDTK